MSSGAATERVDAADWERLTTDLDRRGWAVLPGLITSDDCAALSALYDRGGGTFRSHINMARHGFGQGEYRYFDYPLPALVQQLRCGLYERLVLVAKRWYERLGLNPRFPVAHAAFLERCRIAGQTRPTPLLLKYRQGDYNCLHQDIYGEHVFPLQAAVLLSAPEREFQGGEFILTEQRPRMQSRVSVIPLQQGDAVIFAVNHRPVRGSRDDYRVNLRHGVSEVRQGERYTLGIIFHDAA